MRRSSIVLSGPTRPPRADVRGWCAVLTCAALALGAMGCSDESATEDEQDASTIDAFVADAVSPDVADSSPDAADSDAADAAVCSTAPTGYTPEEHRTFEGGTAGQLANLDGSGFDGLLGGVGNVEFNEAFAWDGSKSARFSMQAANTGDQGAVIHLSNPIGKGEVWIRVYAYFPAGYVFVPNTEGQKFLRADMRASSGTYRGAWDYYIGSDGTYVATGALGASFYSEHCAWTPEGHPCRGLGPDVTRDSWHNYEYYIKLTDVAADGIIRAWVDGTLYYEATAVKTLVEATDEVFQLKIFSGPQPGTYSQDQYAYVDDLVLASDRSPPTNTDLAGNAMIGGTCDP